MGNPQTYQGTKRASILVERHPYLFAAVLVGIAFVARLAADSLLGDQSPYQFFLVAAALAALFSNVRASLMSVVLGALLANYYFVPPRHRIAFGSSADLITLFTYAAAALCIGLVAKTRLTALRKAESGKAELAAAREKLQSTVLALTKTEARVAAQKEALEMAVTGAPLEAVLGRLVLQSRELMDHESRAAIFLVDSDGKHLRFVASAGMSEGYANVVDGFEIHPGQPSCSSVAHTGQPSIVKDVRCDALWARYLSLANEHRIRACWSFPIRSSREQPLGTIAIYHSEVREPNSGELDSISLLTRTAALVIEMKRAEAASETSEQQFIQLAESIPQLAWMADSKGWIFWYNRRWYEYTGTTLEQMQGWGWRAVHHPLHVDRVVRKIQHSWDTGEPWEDTFPLCGADGRYRWFLSASLAHP